jgi:hypothetical protein
MFIAAAYIYLPNHVTSIYGRLQYYLSGDGSLISEYLPSASSILRDGATKSLELVLETPKLAAPTQLGELWSRSRSLRSNIHSEDGFEFNWVGFSYLKQTIVRVGDIYDVWARRSGAFRGWRLLWSSYADVFFGGFWSLSSLFCSM